MTYPGFPVASENHQSYYAAQARASNGQRPSIWQMQKQTPSVPPGHAPPLRTPAPAQMTPPNVASEEEQLQVTISNYPSFYLFVRDICMYLGRSEMDARNVFSHLAGEWIFCERTLAHLPPELLATLPIPRGFISTAIERYREVEKSLERRADAMDGKNEAASTLVPFGNASPPPASSTTTHGPPPLELTSPKMVMTRTNQHTEEESECEPSAIPAIYQKRRNPPGGRDLSSLSSSSSGVSRRRDQKEKRPSRKCREDKKRLAVRKGGRRDRRSYSSSSSAAPARRKHRNNRKKSATPSSSSSSSSKANEKQKSNPTAHAATKTEIHTPKNTQLSSETPLSNNSSTQQQWNNKSRSQWRPPKNNNNRKPDSNDLTWKRKPNDPSNESTQSTTAGCQGGGWGSQWAP